VKMLLRITFLLSLFLLTCSMLVAQSTEMDRPTQLTSREASGEFGSQPITYYYTFEAGPGDFSFFIAAQGIGGTIYLRWEILDANLKNVNGFEYFTASSEEQKIDKFTLKGKEKILIQLKYEPQNARGGKYRFRLSGAVDLPESSNK
jgi:hypothetical protein